MAKPPPFTGEIDDLTKTIEYLSTVASNSTIISAVYLEDVIDSPEDLPNDYPKELLAQSRAIAEQAKKTATWAREAKTILREGIKKLKNLQDARLQRRNNAYLGLKRD